MLIGIGAQKCGTTFLFNALKHHPQIRASHTKELFEFNKADFEPTVERYENYMRHWGTATERERLPEGTVFMEYTPKYLMVCRMIFCRGCVLIVGLGIENGTVDSGLAVKYA